MRPAIRIRCVRRWKRKTVFILLCEAKRVSSFHRVLFTVFDRTSLPGNFLRTEIAAASSQNGWRRNEDTLQILVLHVRVADRGLSLYLRDGRRSLSKGFSDVFRGLPARCLPRFSLPNHHGADRAVLDGVLHV